MQTICTLLQTDNHTNTRSLTNYVPIVSDTQAGLHKIALHATNTGLILDSFYQKSIFVCSRHQRLVTTAFSLSGPRVWNCSPATYTPPHQTRHRQDRLVASGGRCESGIRQITGYGQFRQHLKTHLFRASKSQRIVTVDYRALCKYSINPRFTLLTLLYS